VIVDADERRVRELARNLLSNAVRHARSAVRVTVSAGSANAELAVSNDGESIDPSVRTHIFDRFYRADGRTEGSGLGLSIVRWIAQAHGGEAVVRDCVSGSGVEFVVRIPRLSAQ
jgi:two-component system sensor histidine kinase BaeS